MRVPRRRRLPPGGARLRRLTPLRARRLPGPYPNTAPSGAAPAATPEEPAWDVGLKPGASYAQLVQERVGLQLAPERRRLPVARIDDRVGREPVDERANRREQRLPVAALQVNATDRAGKEQIAREQLALVVERNVARGVTRHVDHLERDPADGDLVAAAHG